MSKKTKKTKSTKRTKTTKKVVKLTRGKASSKDARIAATRSRLSRDNRILAKRLVNKHKPDVIRLAYLLLPAEPTERETKIADALGISVEQLRTAKRKAKKETRK